MKGKYMVAFLLLMVIPFYKVNAGSVKVSVKCNTVTVGETAKCTITGSASGAEVTSFHGRISVSGIGSFESFQTGSGFLGEGSNGVIDLYTDSKKSGTFSIGTVNIKTNAVGSGNLTISGIEASDENFENISGINNASGSFKATEKATTTTTTKKTTTTNQRVLTSIVTTTTTRYIAPLKLTSLTVDDFKVTYENDIYYVTVNEDTTEVNINATAGEGITIIGLGKRSLADGKNTVDLVLKNEFDETATINVIITKPDGKKQVDTKLSLLKVVDYNFTFNPETYEYTINVPYNVKEIYIMAEGKNNDITIKNDGLQVLASGKNTIIVRSTYGDISETKYTITVKRTYTSLIFLIGFIGSILGFGGTLLYTRLRKNKVKDEVVKEMATARMEEKKEENKVVSSINGENSVGIGKRVVIPTKVVSAHVNTANTPEPMMTSAPNPQVKVIKTINTNGINRQVINTHQEVKSDLNGE